MSQNGPYLSQKRPKPVGRGPSNWPNPPCHYQMKGFPMSRTTTKWLALGSLTLAALTSAACTRSDATGPSDQPAASFETQGANN